MSNSNNEKIPLMVGDIFQFQLMRANELEVRSATQKVLGASADEPTLVDEKTFVGIEVEVEGMYPSKYAQEISLAPFWDIKEDGSLRNQGLEFVSPPLRGNAVKAALRVMNEALKKGYPKHDFSDRTSVHVHVNVRDISPETLINFMLVYAVFESALYKSAFDLTQRKRDENIFCVSLFDAGKNLKLAGAIDALEKGDYKRCLGFISSGWRKYSGLNCVPVQSLGTVEFRHLGGTGKEESILAWINLILSMKLFAENQIYPMLRERVLELNTNSMYELFTQQVFRDLAEKILRYNVKKELEKGVNYVKYLFSMNQQQEQIKFSKERFMESSLKDFLDKKKIKLAAPIDFSEKYKKIPLDKLVMKELVLRRDEISITAKAVLVRYRGRRDSGNADVVELDHLARENTFLVGYLHEIDNEISSRSKVA